MVVKTCKDCRFSYSSNDALEGPIVECRRYAPRPHAQAPGEGELFWTLVNENEDWCGEFEEHRNGSSEILAGVARAAERRARERRD